MRLRLDLAYDGTEFSGWAAQPGRRTVAGVLAAALHTVLRSEPGSDPAAGLDPSPYGLAVAGRTDAGVHAAGQVAHIDIEPAAMGELTHADHDPTAVLARRLNGVLPPDVRCLGARVAAAGFDARFAALDRRYRYRIADRPAAMSPLRRADTAWWRVRLDASTMAEAAAGLLGEHDFAAYCRRRDGATTIRGLQRLDVARDGDGVLLIDVQADAFCHSMVRSLVGALAAVGSGRRPPVWAASLLALRERSSEVAVAPAHGLTLLSVSYPPDDQLAARVLQTRQIRELPGDED